MRKLPRIREFVAGALVASAVSCLAACGGGGGDSGGGSDDLFEPRPLPDPGPPKQFVDVTAASGIAYSIGISSLSGWDPNIPRTAVGGVASGDYDNDGDVDLFITRGDLGPNLLYRNDGSGVFIDVAAAAGLAFTGPNGEENYRHSGPFFADMDGDGDLDLFIGGLLGDPSFIFRNDGPDADYRFTDVTENSGIDGLWKPHNISAAFGDYDLDGDLDLFLTHWGTPLDEDDPGDTQHLWRNDTEGIGGDIKFTSVSIEAGIAPSIINLFDPLDTLRGSDFTFAPSFARIDGDLYPDIVVAADFNTSMVFLNDGDADGDGVADGTFTNATDVDVIIDNAGMGSALGDYDFDGDLDWFVSSIGWRQPNDGNRFYRNTLGDPEAEGIFEDVTEETGTGRGGWGWGSCFMDFENDGDLDLYHTNGWSGNPDYFDDPSVAFVSNGAGVFEERARDLGLDDLDEGRGIVCADFDNDGDTDILQLHRSSPVAATMWRNNTSTNNFLSVLLHGRPPNTQAANARIYATIGEQTQMREIVIGNNFVSQNPTIQIFGLGSAAQVDELRIEWPDGRVQEGLGPFAAGQRLEFTEPGLEE